MYHRKKEQQVAHDCWSEQQWGNHQTTTLGDYPGNYPGLMMKLVRNKGNNRVMMGPLSMEYNEWKCISRLGHQSLRMLQTDPHQKKSSGNGSCFFGLTSSLSFECPRQGSDKSQPWKYDMWLERRTQACNIPLSQKTYPRLSWSLS